MNATSRLFYTISFLSTLLRQLRSEHKIPVFANLWYGDARSLGYDACGTYLQDYGYMASSPYDLMLMTTTDPGNGCAWDYESFYNCGSYTEFPASFISSNENDWAEILKDPSAPLPTEYSMKGTCPGLSGYSIVTSFYMTPFYDCPPHTRLSYDNVTMEIGCTTTPTPCVGDIVGRDLGSDGGEFFGHVGLVATWGHTNPSILEVLNGTNFEPTKIGIFLDPLYGENSFVTQTKYWGSRYEPQNFTRLPLTLASQVIQAGIDQQQYLFNYTWSTFYYPGGTQEHPDNCQFRCDSFVYYCYDAGAQIKLQLVLDPLFTVPWTIFNDFMCSADPVEYCSAYTVTQNTTLTLLNKAGDIDLQRLKHSDHTSKVMTDAQKIFQSLRPALATKPAQKNQLLRLIEEYQGDQNSNISELFVRCLCFELEKMNPSQLDHNIRPLLSNLLWQHKYLSNDNFLLALMENTLSFYLENPHCDWLSAFFTVKAETQVDKEIGMIAYVDQQDNVTEKANLITASRFSSLFTLTDEKRRSYGSLFRQAYHADQYLSEMDKKLILLSLSEMKTPITETDFSAQFFQKANIKTNRGFQLRHHP